MGRARNIKPAFFSNEDLVELSFATRLLFVGLWTEADKEGRLEDRPKKIKMAIFPADDVDVNSMLDELASSGFVVRYEVNGGKYIAIPAWHKHQRPHYSEKPSIIPDVFGRTPEKRTKNSGELRNDGGETPENSGETKCEDVRNPPDTGYLIPDTGYLIEDACQHASRTSPENDAGDFMPTEVHPVDQPSANGVSAAGAVCVALRSIGIPSVSPANPKLLALIAGGVDIETFVSVGKDCVARGKPFFAYLLTVVESAEKEARDLATMLQKKKVSKQPMETAYQRSMRERVEAISPDIARKAPEDFGNTVDFFDVQARIVETKRIGGES